MSCGCLAECIACEYFIEYRVIFFEHYQQRLSAERS